MWIRHTKYKIQNTNKGVSIIEALVLLFVFSVMVLSFYTAYSVGLSRIVDSRYRLQAISLASEQMEKIRNLPYDEVRAGTSIPGCDTSTETCYIDADYTVTLSNTDFRVQTDVLYEDDAEDGTLALSTDPIPTDYKRVTVMASWSDDEPEKQMTLVSRFVPPGLESGVPGTGALSINVLDYAGQPVGNVEVTIVNNNVSPAVNLNTYTDSNGNVLLYGVAADDSYELSLEHASSPNAYEHVQTLPLPPDNPYTPIDANVSVVTDVLNTATFAFNETSSSLKMRTVDPYGNAISGVDFDLGGGRRLDVGEDPPVYNYSGSHETDGGGEVTIPSSGVGLSGGTYTVTINESGYALWAVDPSTDKRDTLYLDYGISDSIKDIVLVDESVNGLLIVVADNDTGDPISGATVDVTDPVGTSLDSQTTDVYGIAYFPENETDVLLAGAYTVTVSATGYHDDTENPSITSGLEQVSITLQSS